jgi:2-succinyl-6-hydroxy-2,4-cyclohexadiene-1-carboxylate synthase
MRLNDLEFNVEVDGSGPPLLLLHGFTGSVRTWDEIRPTLRNVAQVITIDLIGHGRSAAPDDPRRYSFEWATRDVLALLDSMRLPSVDLLGYSMGGRLALHLALEMPERIGALLVESASPGIEDPLARRQRIDSDAALAERILRNGIHAFVDEWERLPLLQLAPHVSAETVARQRTHRIENSPLGLANSLLGMGAGQQPPVWSQLKALTLPVSLLVGADDARYTELAQRMAQLLPAADIAVVAAAGHTVHLDQPERFVEHVKAGIDKKLTHPATRC